jgi:hypothetical protein
MIITGLALTTSAEAQEKKIKRSDLPPDVEKTVVAQSSGATIEGFKEVNFMNFRFWFTATFVAVPTCRHGTAVIMTCLLTPAAHAPPKLGHAL